MTFTDNQYEILKNAEPHFVSAKHNTVRNAPYWMTSEVIRVYEEATGKRLPSRDVTCAVCVLRIYQIVGKEFFNDAPFHQKSEIVNILTTNTLEDENAKQSENNSVGNAKPNRRNKKENKGSSK